MAHLSIDRSDPASDRRFDRHLKFGSDSGMDPKVLKEAHERMRTQLNCVGPDRDEALLHEAGFSGIEPVFRGLYWCGWVAYA